MSDKKAVVLSSGGIDSTTVMAIAKSEGYAIHSLSFHYGQRHAWELEAAKRVARFFGAQKHLVMGIDLRQIGGSALTDDIDVPKGRSDDAMQEGIPITYVPARNTIFLSYALAVGGGPGGVGHLYRRNGLSITAGIPIAVPNSSPPSRRLRTWP